MYQTISCHTWIDLCFKVLMFLQNLCWRLLCHAKIGSVSVNCISSCVTSIIGFGCLSILIQFCTQHIYYLVIYICLSTCNSYIHCHSTIIPPNQPFSISFSSCHLLNMVYEILDDSHTTTVGLKTYRTTIYCFNISSTHSKT